MQRIASQLVVYALSLTLFVIVLMFCIYMAKTQSDVPAAAVYGVGVGLYTVLLLYLLHRRAGTLSASPEERRRGAESESEPADI